MATLFLDLDGTLVDPAAGVIRAFRHGLDSVGVTAPAADTLGWIIGPALVDSFARLGVADPGAALAAYRECYTGGAMFEAAVYPGIPEALEALTVAGHVLHLATAKPRVFARKVTAHYGLDRFLARQFGPELDGTRNDKAELLAFALAETGDDPAQCLMIGDRTHDYRAARLNDMRALAVSWGYGSDNERAEANAVCAAPGDLPQAVAALLG